MKKDKWFICILSTTLLFPSYTVYEVHAETAKTVSENAQTDDTKISKDRQTSKDTNDTSKETVNGSNADSKYKDAKYLSTTHDTALEKLSTDYFSNPFLLFTSQPVTTTFWGNWLTPTYAETSSTGETRTHDAHPLTQQSLQTSNQKTPINHATTQNGTLTSSQDSHPLPQRDQKVADELDSITASIQSETSSQLTEDTSSRSEETDSTDAHSKTTPTNEHRSTTQANDRDIEALLDEYSEKSQKQRQLTNPQLPSDVDIEQSEVPKQSFDNELKQSNMRSTATFETRPNLSSPNTQSVDYQITENKATRDFIKSIAKEAHDIGQNENIYASVMIAQAILESDSGNSALAQAPYHNLFGIKGAYYGQSVTFNTLEDNGNSMYQIAAQFRSYPNQNAALKDYATLIKHGIDGNPTMYQPTWKSEARTYREATSHLSHTYATDTHYAEKLNSIIHHYDLTRFDKKAMPKSSEDDATYNETPMAFKTFTESGHSPYPHGQCTWYVYERMAQFGLPISGDLGDAHNWDNRAASKGYTISLTPTPHSAVVFEAGQLGADSHYGHVAFVEKVLSDGTIIISESNVKGLGVISYRTIDADDAQYLTYIKSNN
ncbi:amidase domain-containing protein [Staphylococcus ratti]|uniref:Amidase domain-containing protein n=1 Tax=Staphylococcus ratti TaxID=2892440 RepID=A0ABY3PCW4_9STAP|nr:amidase domain-containing protein [Staphylococcus ratti]UEX90161.1 amidase domain-containing protein [Staphylococcus ratti]